MEISVEEIRKLREEIEALRRDIAQLNGRLDVIEDFILLPKIQSDAEARTQLETLQKQHAELKAASAGRVFRYLESDPRRKKLEGYTIRFKCLHQVDHVIIAESIAFLSNSLFDTPCECRKVG